MDSTGFTYGATRRALAIPEVATLIFGSGSLSRPDLTRLCRVSRYMLGIGTPLLWRSAAAEGLLGLIEDVYFGWNPGDLDTIELDLDVGEKTFKRFHFYAHYVHILEIYDRESRLGYTVKGWSILKAEMKARGSPLLPNLSTLRFYNTSPSHGFEEMKWITVFATSRVQEISLVPNRSSSSGQIPFSVASTMLATIFKICPGLQTLALAPDDEIYPNTSYHAQFFAALKYHPTRVWYQELRGLIQLRHLTISDGWLYPASLRVLGHLPEMESLTIVQGPCEDFDLILDMVHTLPDGSFPRLIELSLIGLEAWGISEILKVEAMVRQITKMKLEFYIDHDEPDDPDDEYWGIKRIFEGIHNVPCLRELYISFPFQPAQGERPANVYDLMKETGPQPFLEYIHLKGLRIDKEFLPAPSTIRALSSIWSNVRNLSMPSQHASFRELEYFATLPSLLNLTFKLNLSSPYLPKGTGFGNAPLKTLTSSGSVRLCSIYQDLSLSAHALLLLWPSLRRVTWSDKDPIRTELAEHFNSEVLRFNREFLFGSPRETARLSATKSAKEMKVQFKSIMEDLEEVDSDSDTCSEWSEDSEQW